MISCSRSSSCLWRIITDSMMALSSGVKWDRSGPFSILSNIGCVVMKTTIWFISSFWKVSNDTFFYNTDMIKISPHFHPKGCLNGHPLSHHLPQYPIKNCHCSWFRKSPSQQVRIIYNHPFALEAERWLTIANPLDLIGESITARNSELIRIDVGLALTVTCFPFIFQVFRSDLCLTCAETRSSGNADFTTTITWTR